MSAVIVGAKGGAGSQHTPVETADSLHAVQRARIIDAISEGPILGFAHGGTNPLLDVYLNETPAATADGQFNFADVEIDSRKGTQDQDPMAQFANVENEIGVGVELRYGTPWTQAISDLDLSALRLHISVPQLQKSDTSTGDITGYGIQYKIEVATDGGAYVEVETSGIKGKSSDEYVKTHYINLPEATSTGWVVRVTRLTTNADSATIADTTTIKSYTEIVDAKLRYPNTALVGIVINAKQFSSIPSRAYDIYGRVISVPSNYDPATRAYTGTWDGSFKPAWTDNPAWIFYDIVTHPRYGLGQWISASKIDKWGLYQIAQYCDELVPDGKGGQEPRFTCNLYIQSQADAYKVLADLTSIFRGMAFWAGGTIQSCADMPGDPEFVYTNANVVDGRFSYQGSDRKTRFTVALVSWNDPNDFYRAKVAYVPDRDGIARYGVRETRIIAIGATSEGQAQRAGLHALLTSRLETEVVTFEVGQDGHLVAPGRIARIADAKRAKNRQGGRIHSATATVVTLDKEPGIIEIGGSLTVMLPSGVSETRTISAISGRDLTVSTAFSELPQPEAAWVAEASTLAAQTVRILSVAQSPSSSEDSLKFTVTALQHNASKFDAIDYGAMIVTPPTVPIDGGYLPAPTVVSVTSYARKGTTRAIPVLEIGWPRVTGATKYLVQYRRDNGEWSVVHEVTGNRLEVRDVLPGDYVAQVAAANKIAESLATVSDPYTLDDSALTPTILDDLQSQVSDAQADATAAMNEIANFSQDGVLVPTEKKRIIVDYNVITTEQPGIDAQAAAFAITTEKTTYDSAVTALTTYLATIPAWNDITVDTAIVRATFNSKWQAVYTTRQALLNAIYAAAKAKADAAQATADTGKSLASQVAVVNPGFDAGDTGWTKESGWSIKTDGSFGFGLGYAEKTGGASDAALRNTAVCYVQENKSYRVQALIKAIGANGQCYARISWRDLNDAEIGVTNGNFVTGTTVAGSFAVGQAPTGAVFAHAEIAASSHTTGTYQVDNVISTLQPATADEIDESGGRKWAAESGATNGFNKGSNLLRNPTGTAGFFGWNGGFVGTGQQTMTTRPDVPVGMAFACTVGAASADQGISQYVQSSSGISSVTFTVSGWFYTGYQLTGTHFIQIRQLDANGAEISGAARPAIQVPIGVSSWQYLTATFTTTSGCYGLLVVARCTGTGSGGQNRWAQLKLEVGSSATPFNYTSTAGDQLGVDGSGHKLGGLRNQLMVGVGNFASAWSGGSISYSASSTSATITAAAATLVLGSVSKAYNQSSTTVSGSAGVSTKFYLYYDDDDYSGGSQTLHATTSQITSLNANGRLLVGTVTVNFPTSGTSGGSGGTGCVAEDAWVIKRGADGRWMPIRARDARVGDWIRGMDPTTGRERWVRISYRRRFWAAERVTVHVSERARLTCTSTGPLGTADMPVLARDAAGVRIAVKEGACLTYREARVEAAAPGWAIHLTAEHAFFLAGDDPHGLLAHHNMKPT